MSIYPVCAVQHDVVRQDQFLLSKLDCIPWEDACGSHGRGAGCPEAGGRCETCQGDGMIKVEMHFLPDVYVACDHCKGSRYNRETLDVKYKGKNIAEVLEMTVEEARAFFDLVPVIATKLQTLMEVGVS